MLAHGVFDLLHMGHMRHLEAARREGDLLFVIDPRPYRFAVEQSKADLERATTLDRTRASAWSALSTVNANSDDLTAAKVAAQ